MNKAIFTCEACLEVFEAVWTDEEAREEQKKNGWSGMDNDDMATVCDDCYKQFMGVNNEHKIQS